MLNNIPLDVTLRDGSFRVNFAWTETSILKIVDGLVQLGIPFIELGFHGGIGSLLQQFTQSSSTITDNFPLLLAKKLSDEYPQTKFVFMIHPIALDTLNYKEIKESGIYLLRFIEQEDTIQLYRNIKEAKNAGLKISLNITSASKYSFDELTEIASQRINSLSPDILYVADTFGSFYPDKISELYKTIDRTNINNVKLGFHAHDNLSLAFSNCLSAVNSNATYIDVSVLGLGKGSGNLQSELWCIHSIQKGNAKYKIEAFYPIIEEIDKYCKVSQNRDLITLIASVCNLNSLEIDKLNKSAKEKGLSYGLVAFLFNKNKLKERNNEL